ARLHVSGGAARFDGDLTVAGTGASSFAGNLGIGTTAPQASLQVSGGAARFDGDQQIQFTDQGTSNSLKLQLWSGYGLGINAGTLFSAADGRHSWRDARSEERR